LKTFINFPAAKEGKHESQEAKFYTKTFVSSGAGKDGGKTFVQLSIGFSSNSSR